MFKYEMHIHSSPCSGGGDDIRNHIAALLEKGFSGMVITNHFIRGDTRIDRLLPWKDFVDQYRKDFETGKRIAEDCDFDLLFGIEVSAPVIKCKKTPNKKCRFLAERRNK